MTQSLVELFACHADQRAEHIFITERDTGTSLTYGEAITRVVSAAHFFMLRGVHRGDRVAMLMENRMEWVTTFLAAQSIGAIVVPLNTRLTGEELQSHIDDCDPKAIVIDSRHTGVIGSDDPRIVECSQLPVDHNMELSLAGSADDPAVITYTSGTTGSPKGVVLSHRALHLSSMTYAAIFNSGPDFATPVAVPLFHNTGFIDGLGHAVVAGGSVELYRRFDPVAITEGLSKGEYSFFIGVPTMYRRMLEHTAPTMNTARNPLWLAYGGAPMPAATAERLFERFEGARLVNCYGMSEATSITHYLPADLSSGRWDEVGIPVPGTADRINEQGELEVKSPTAMLGYWRRDQEFRAASSTGWLRTGDCATKDEHGVVRITGRMDDFINRGGEKIAPREVEAAICRLEGVVEVVVIGIPDTDLGQVPAALLVVRGDSFDVTYFRNILSDHLADYKIPAYVYCVDELPRNANGKIVRSKVRTIIDERLASGSLGQS